MRHRCAFYASAILIVLACGGCRDLALGIPGATWHQKAGWRAEEFFDDPKVIALCRAIQANDIAEIDRLVASGAGVNAKGKDNMTPLLWAFPDNKLERFKRLLEHGADPNVAVTSDLGAKSAVLTGETITHMACKTSFPGYFEAVFSHGGDPNLVQNTSIISNETPLFTVITGSSRNKAGKVKQLIDLGADIDHVNGTGRTPVSYAVTWGNQFEIAILLLDSGADHRICKPGSTSRLVHSVIEVGIRSNEWTNQQKAAYQQLVKWLEDHGESIDAARADAARWESWSITTGEFRRKMAAEVAEREAREKAANDAKKDGK